MRVLLFTGAKIDIIASFIYICVKIRNWTMDALSIFAIILGAVGLVGSFLPVLPGPPISWIGLLLVYFSATAKDGVTMGALVVALIFATVVTVMDYVLPSVLTKLAGGHKSGSMGAFIGMILGIFFTPVGMVLGSFLGALVAELMVEKQDLAGAFSAAMGTFVSFILTTGIKAIYCVVILWVILVKIF